MPKTHAHFICLCPFRFVRFIASCQAKKLHNLSFCFVNCVSAGMGSCTVLYNYAPTTPGQLSLKQGEKITILSKAREHVGLWKGRLGSQVQLSHTVKLTPKPFPVSLIFI